MRDDRTLDTQITPGDPTDRSDDTPSTDRWTALRASAGYARNLLYGPARARVALATGVLCCLGLAAVAQTQGESADAATRADALTASAGAVQRAEQDRPSRDAERTATSATPATPAADPDTDARPTRKPKPVDPAPVAGLTEAQMENAEAIVRTGREMGVPRRALVIAVATAMQESNLYNYASGVLPESQNYPHQAIGWDHDSVGLFQQRPSSGWGPVGRLMEPEFATRQFLSALEQVPGWQRMRLTDAAQAVQISAYPEHYAKHEWRASKVVEAIVPAGK
ncbi:peptidase M23 [Micromonospora sp. C28SCA-DRY-2]|uniref:peptidase M23 n=1 Tax=Micromonospora sp. C28SCA-DRY-2 TaxID=3059522 RepID=UPI00267635FF|nr:peptidase M23 [Micromonospora sp. C28SCA-DRY-2]MDO3705980.1 peptidase M23 [Micromonospora sp. C28SCA-DRY-2]